MTNETTLAILQTVDKLQEARAILDGAMFRGLDVPQDEYLKLRGIYDLICKAIDLT